MALLFDNGCTYMWGENIKLLHLISTHILLRELMSLCSHFVPKFILLEIKYFKEGLFFREFKKNDMENIKKQFWRTMKQWTTGYGNAKDLRARGVV
jgi:hypothetical protein